MSVRWSTILLARRYGVLGYDQEVEEFGTGLGDEGGMVGTADEVGAELARFLNALRKDRLDELAGPAGRPIYFTLVIEVESNLPPV